MIKRYFYIFIFIIFSVNSFAHGINYKIITSGIIGIRFTYEGGMAMKNAKVLIFEPGNYDKPSITKQTNNNGMVYFKALKKGEYVVMAKQAGGHVKRVNVKTGKNIDIKQTQSFSLIRKIFLSIAVVWALLMTSLYFKCKNKK